MTLETNAKKPDRRISRTRRLLKEALLSLVIEKGYDAITVEEVAARADVARATFYLHYKDKEDLLLESLDAMVDDLIEQISSIPLSAWKTEEDGASGSARLTPILLIFQHADQNGDLYRIILRDAGASQVSSRLRDIIAAAVIEFLKVKAETEGFTLKPAIPLEVFSNYFAGALLGFITWWLEAGKVYSAERMAEMFQQMFFPGAARALEVSFP